MKKVILGVAVAAAIGAGGYFALNKGKQMAGSFGEEQIKAFITENKNKAYPITSLQSYPFIERADITITESTDVLIKSFITIKAVGEKAVEIPLISEITRGEFTYADENYAFGKIVTKPNLKNIDNLPPFINKDTLTNTSYLGLNGDLASVTNINPIKVKDSNIDFKGLTVIADTSVLDSSTGILNLDFAGMTSTGSKDKFDLSKFTATFTVNKDGSYTGETSPFTVNIETPRNPLSIKLSKGTYAGTQKLVEDLDYAISNGTSKYDSLSIVADGKPVSLKNIMLEGGIYDVGNKAVDVKLDISGDVDATALQDTMQIPLNPKSVRIAYGINNIGYDALNLYVKKFSSLEKNSQDIVFSDAELKTLTQSLQKSGAGLNLSAEMKAIEGDAVASFDFAINDSGKAADYQIIADAFQAKNSQALASYFNGKMHVKISKSIAQITNTGMYLMLAGAEEKDDTYVINGELKDGAATLNGNPVPGM